MVEDVPRPLGMPSFGGGGGGGGKPPHDGHPPEPDGDPEEEEEEEEGKGKGKGGGGGGGCPGAGFHGMPFPPLPRNMPQLYLDLRCSTLALLKRRALSTMQSLTELQHSMCFCCMLLSKCLLKRQMLCSCLCFLQVLPRLQHHELHQEGAVC